MFSTKQFLVSLLAATASAAVVPRQASPGEFTVTGLSIGATNSVLTEYSFYIADLSVSPSNFSTFCYASTPTSPGLASVPVTLCDDETVEFTFANNGTGYILEMQHNWGIDVQHAIVLAHDDFEDTAAVFWGNDVLVNGQTETGGPFLAKINTTPDFTIGYTRFS